MILSNSTETHLGKLSWNKPQEAKNDKVEINYEMSIPYGRVYSGLSKVAKLLSPKMICSVLDKAQNYTDIETPCGKIINDQWKEMTVIPVDAYEGVHSGYTVTMNAFDIPVWLSRQTQQGKYSEASLDIKGDIEKMSSKNFGDDISIRWNPMNNGAEFDMCLNVPGGTVTAPRRDIFVRAKKKTWYGHFSTSTDLETTWGQLSWKYGRTCFRVQYFNEKEGYTPDQTIQFLKTPYLFDIQYTGLNVRIGNWFLRLIDNIMNFFKSSIRKAMIKKINNSVNNLADQEVESGAWFTKVYTEVALKKNSEQLHTRIKNLLERSGGFITTERVQDMIRDNCRLLKYSKSPLWSERMQKFCIEISNTIEISMNPVARNTQEEQLGCYNYYANIHSVKKQSGQKVWWANQCNYSLRFTIRVSRNAADQLEDIHELIQNQIEELRIPNEWQELLDANELDEVALNLLLEEAEKRGYKELSLQDLQNLMSNAKELLH